MEIQIITDSAADYTQEELKRRNIRCVPMSITFGDEQFIDGVTITKEQFYDKLMESKELPKTSQPSPADFLDIFKDDGKRSASTTTNIYILNITLLINGNRFGHLCIKEPKPSF